MNPIVFSLIVITSGALAGWLISRFFIWLLFRPQSPQKMAGIVFTGILPALKPLLTENAGRLAGEIDLKNKLSGNITMEKLMPEIEVHVDEFLKVRLKEAFPLLANFMGEKTLSKFKETFLQEVSARLPVLVENYVAKLAGDFDVKKMIADKVEAMDMSQLESMIKDKAKKQLVLLQVAGMILGVLAAAFQIIIFRLL